MIPRRRRISFMLLLLVALAVLASACSGNRNFQSAPTAGSGTPPVGPRLGATAPDFSLQSLDGSPIRLSELRGRPVLVNFWATWCPPCKEEMPGFEKVWQKVRGDGILFLGISREDAATVRDFVTKGGYNWTFLLDPADAAYRAYEVTGFPESYFIDRDGILRDKVIGPMTPDMLEKRLSRIH